MLLIIFMVLIFNSLSSPEIKKQQHMYYLRQAQKIMQWLHPSFPEGSTIVQDSRAPTPAPPPPHLMWKSGVGTDRNFCKDDVFS